MALLFRVGGHREDRPKRRRLWTIPTSPTIETGPFHAGRPANRSPNAAANRPTQVNTFGPNARRFRPQSAWLTARRSCRSGPPQSKTHDVPMK